MKNDTKGFPEPEFVGKSHLLRFHQTTGDDFAVDPEEITSITPHRSDAGVTVLKIEADSYKYFVDAPYAVVDYWVSVALSGD